MTLSMPSLFYVYLRKQSKQIPEQLPNATDIFLKKLRINTYLSLIKARKPLVEGVCEGFGEDAIASGLRSFLRYLDGRAL